MLFSDHSRDIYNYAEALSDSSSDLLNELYRETYLKTLKPRMASGLLQGRILAFISRLLRPSHIVEIGTFTGYATLCLAEGLTKNGKVTTIEVNPELSFISDKYFDQSLWADQIHPVVGDALEIIPTLSEDVDLVFIDAKKQDYIRYYELIFEKVRAGGILLADNILWDGKVLDSTPNKTTKSIQQFNEYVYNDDRVNNVILPLRDGVNMILKK